MSLSSADVGVAASNHMHYFCEGRLSYVSKKQFKFLGTILIFKLPEHIFREFTREFKLTFS